MLKQAVMLPPFALIVIHLALHASATTGLNPCTESALAQNRFYHPYPQDPAQYIQCTQWGTPVVRPCPPVQLWSVQYNVCVDAGTLYPLGGTGWSTRVYQAAGGDAGSYQATGWSMGSFQPPGRSTGSYQPKGSGAGSYQPSGRGPGFYQLPSGGSYQPSGLGLHQPAGGVAERWSDGKEKFEGNSDEQRGSLPAVQGATDGASGQWTGDGPSQLPQAWWPWRVQQPVDSVLSEGETNRHEQAQHGPEVAINANRQLTYSWQAGDGNQYPLLPAIGQGQPQSGNTGQQLFERQGSPVKSQNLFPPPSGSKSSLTQPEPNVPLNVGQQSQFSVASDSAESQQRDAVKNDQFSLSSPALPILYPVNPCLFSNVRYFAHPGDPSKFFECLDDGRLELMSCPGSQTWVQVRQGCLHLMQEPFGEGSFRNLCVGRTSPFLPFPGDNTKFIVCHGPYVLDVGSCEAGQFWVQDYQICASPLLSGETDSLPYPPGPPPSPNSPATSGSGGYDGNVPDSWNQPMQSGDSAWQPSGTSTNGLGVCVSNVTYYHAYPADRTRFLQCDEYGNVYLRACGPNKIWRDDYKTCVGMNNITAGDANAGSQGAIPGMSGNSKSTSGGASSNENLYGIDRTETVRILCPVGYGYNAASGMCEAGRTQRGVSMGTLIICPQGFTFVVQLSLCVQHYVSAGGLITINATAQLDYAAWTFRYIFYDESGQSGNATSDQTNITANGGGANRTSFPVFSGDNPCGRGQGFYFPYPGYPTLFLQCDASGAAYVQICPSGLRWDQSYVTCVAQAGANVTGSAVSPQATNETTTQVNNMINSSLITAVFSSLMTSSASSSAAPPTQNPTVFTTPAEVTTTMMTSTVTTLPSSLSSSPSSSSSSSSVPGLNKTATAASDILAALATNPAANGQLQSSYYPVRAADIAAMPNVTSSIEDFMRQMTLRCANNTAGPTLSFSPHPTDRMAYVVCARGVATLQRCPVGHVWDQSLLTCRTGSV